MGFILFLLLVIVGYIAFRYNGLQKLAQEVRESSSNIQVAISKKVNLINQLIDVVKNYQEGEQFTHLKISQDNAAANMMASYQQSGSVMASLQGMAERFPNLKASDQYQRLMDSIQHCEADIQGNRQRYNHHVKQYNSIRVSIPTVFFAKSLGFSEAPYLEFDVSGANMTTLKNFTTDDGGRLTQMLTNAGKGVMDAGKSIAGHASQAGKAIADKVKDSTSNKYYYSLPGGVPQGPATLDEINHLVVSGKLAAEVMLAEAGSQEWRPLSSFATMPVPPPPPPPPAQQIGG